MLDDHLRSVELAKESVDLNNLKNAEVYLSDLFSAVPKRKYHQIFSNPPQQMGNEFLEELIGESFKHLKSKGGLMIVVKNNIGPVIERILQKVFGNLKVVANNKQYIVVESILP